MKVLEEKTFRRLGDVRDRRINVRLLAATHHNIVQLVRRGQFRSDLFFRINIIPLVTPALRDRREDIPLLASRFLRTLGSTASLRTTPTLSEGAVRLLQSYPWPGNIRELRNLLERAVLLAEDDVLTESDLHFDIAAEVQSTASGRTLNDIERAYIEEVLTQEGGRVGAAAKRLGVPRSSLYHKLKQYGIGKAVSN